MKIIINESPFGELFGMQLEIVKLIPERHIVHKNVLDIGCGFGWFENWALHHKVKKIIGLDVSDEELNIARAVKNRSADFVVGSGVHLPFKDNAFDTVVSWEVIEHIPKNTERVMVSEVYRVLKPGGYFFCSTQHANFFSTILDPAWWLIGHRHYKTDSLVKLVESSGLKVKRVYVKGGTFNILYALNLYISKWIFRRNIFFKEFFYKNLAQEFSNPKGFTNIILKCVKPI